MAYQIQIRRDTANNWTTVNPILAQGEWGWEYDTLKIKLGDGISNWNNLPYLTNTPLPHAITHIDGTDDIQDATSSQKGLATSTQISKLNGIEANAQANVNADWNSIGGDSQILNKPTDLTDLSAHSATELNDISNSGSGNIITNTERTKLNGIEDNAEVNQTDAEIKTQYENNADTNAYTDTEKTKLATIEDGAKVNVQSDWNQTISTEDDFIKNKPTIVSNVWENISNVLKPKTQTDEVQIIPTGGIANTIPITDADGVAKDTEATIESAPAGGSMLGLEIYATEPVAPTNQNNLYAVQTDSNTITLVISNGTDVFKVEATKA